jgi:hypothetical protein
MSKASDGEGLSCGRCGFCRGARCNLRLLLLAEAFEDDGGLVFEIGITGGVIELA